MDEGDRILVVDNDQELQRLIRQALEAKGYRVETADDGLAAVDFLRISHTDLVVLDLLMPTLDGWAALAQVERLPQPPQVVVVSDALEANITPRIFREGVSAFIAKPFRMDSLTNTCQELIARARGRPLFDERRSGARRTLALPVDLLDLEGRPLHSGRVVNLSAFGAQAELAAALPPGHLLRLACTTEQGEKVVVDCRVEWWRHEDPPSSVTSHGLAFIGVSPEDQRRLKEIAALD